MNRSCIILMLAVFGGAAGSSPTLAQSTKPVAPAARKKTWVTPRTPDGHPDFQGNWSNGTMTPLERPAGYARALNVEQATKLEKSRAENIETRSKNSDPDRPAPPKGGDGSTGAAGGVGGYNAFWIDAGDHLAIVNGERRSSFILEPANGRMPPLTPAGRERLTERTRQLRQFGEYDNPENRPLAERCVMSFGSNAGPPMLPNYFYNTNDTIGPTKDHVMIMTEMVHDVRMIELKPKPPLPRTMRPWMGDSRGRWVGDTLVVETTNMNQRQLIEGFITGPAALSAGSFGASTSAAPFRGASDDLKITERLHRVDAKTLLYRFTIDDPATFTQSWSGELPFLKMDQLIYEYACHEGNYALSNVLSGERSREREAAAKPVKP